MIRAVSILLASLAIAAPAWAGAPRAVPTFESIGVYWPLAGQADSDCAMLRAKRSCMKCSDRI